MESGPTASPPVSPGPPTGPQRILPPGVVLGVIGVVVVAAVLIIGAVWILPSLGRGPTPSGGPPASAIAVAPTATVDDLSAPSATASTPNPTILASPGPPFASSGSIAVVGNDGSLSLVDATGRSSLLSPPGDGSFLFPAWSPDGSRVAAIHAGPPDNAVLIYDPKRAGLGQPVAPVVIFRSSTIGPFYLSWTPDGRNVSFLADEPEGLSLRIAPADGSAPLDGSGPGAKIRSGNPFYFDWIDRDRLLAHIGTGSSAFLGEIGLDGGSTSPALKAPGDFRPAVVSRDRKFVSYVRAGTGGSADVVVAARDGSSERTMPVFGTAAVVFDPVGDTVASIGPTQLPETPYVIPLGPLRLISPTSGKVRTLVDGSVVSVWWSPDGATIAALRVQPIAAASAGSQTPTSSPLPSPAGQATEVRILFVDVASGKIRSQRVVQLGRLFIDQFLTYFDQYALSHRLWAPDSSSLLLPVVDSDGTTRIAVTFRNGDPPRMIDGAIGFWSP
jgi:TolB protein